MDPLVENYYQRLFAMAAIEELDSEMVQFSRYVDSSFKLWLEYFVDVIDRIGVTNWNVHCHRRQDAIKTLFPGRRRTSNREQENIKYIPGVGKIQIVPNDDWED